MNRKRLNNCAVYDYLKTHTIEEAMVKFNASDKALQNIKRIGDDLLSRRTQPLDQFTPRDLMTELARRGYRGELTFVQKININDF